MGDDGPTCPVCGAGWGRQAPRYIVDGKLSDMRTIEASGKYYESPEKYDDTTVTVYKCGNVIPDGKPCPEDTDTDQ
jgi:hypothetical protein